jgi:hypothetical protein
MLYQGATNSDPQEINCYQRILSGMFIIGIGILFEALQKYPFPSDLEDTVTTA